MNLNPGHLPTYKTLFPVLRTQTGAALKHSCASFPENNALSARLMLPTCVKRYPPSSLSSLIASCVESSDFNSTCHRSHIKSTCSMRFIAVPSFCIEEQVPNKSTKLNKWKTSNDISVDSSPTPQIGSDFGHHLRLNS